jgi:hypothetical protein
MIGMTFDSNAGKVVIFYEDEGNSNYGTAVVGTVDSSDNSISFGTPVVFNSGATRNVAETFDSSNNKVVVAYRDQGNSSQGTAIVGTVSGTSISFGSEAVFNTGSTSKLGCTFDSSNNKVVISYQDGGNSSYGTAVVGTVSGTSISFGSEAVFESASTDVTRATFDSSNNKVVIAYIDGGNSDYGTAIVGTVSGTSISFGSAVVFESGAINSDQGLDCTFDSANNKVIIAFVDNGDSDKGKAIVGTVSGTSISFGTAVVFNNAATTEVRTTFDSNVGKAVVFYNDSGDTNRRHTFISGTVSGTSISFGSEVEARTESDGSDLALTFDSTNNKVVCAFRKSGGTTVGKSIVHQVDGTSENLTTENFIGTSAHAAADGAKVLVNTQGAIDENQSGLTAGQTFFVDKNGALQLTTNVSASLGSTSTTIPASSSTAIGYAGGTFDSSNGKVVAIFQDQGDSNKGKARVGTVDTSDNSISFGTVATAHNASINYPASTFDSNSNRVVAAFGDDGNNGYGTAVVGAVSGTDISFGSATVFENANTFYVSAAFDSSNNKVVIAYTDGGNNYGTAVVGTVDPSDNSISFGTPVVYESANTGTSSVVFDSSNNKVVISYRDGGNSDYGTSIVGTVSGTSISFGTAAVFHTTDPLPVVSAFDSTNNKVVIAYKDTDDSDKGKAVIGTVSGTSISFGSPAVFEAGALGTSGTTGIGIVYDSNAEKIVIHYEDGGDSNYSKLIVGTVSGTSISFAGELTTYTTNALYQNAIFDSTNNRVVLVWNNFAKVYSNAEDLSGSLSHDAVTAGTALSATKLLVKG